jgi:hypothetical protein
MNNAGDHRIWRVRGQGDANGTVAQVERVHASARLAHQRVRIWRVEAEHLVKHVRGHSRPPQRRDRYQRVGNVADNGRARCPGFLDGLSERRDDLTREWVRKLPAE